MKIIIVFAIVVISLLIFWRKGRENFQNAKPFVTLYYTNWCGHCKTMKPIWASVKNSLQSKIQFIEVDCDVIKSPKITGYPTIILSNKSGDYTYTGGPTYSNLYTWVLSHQ